MFLAVIEMKGLTFTYKLNRQYRCVHLGMKKQKESVNEAHNEGCSKISIIFKL